LVEKIRAGAAGIPGFYTQTGVNTLVHLGGEPIKFDKNGTLQVKSLPKEVIIRIKLFKVQLKLNF
jgi:acyl CoA:acetate/3-ketoacid CoA transferase alpha subunit